MTIAKKKLLSDSEIIFLVLANNLEGIVVSECGFGFSVWVLEYVNHWTIDVIQEEPKGRVHKTKTGKSLVFCQTGAKKHIEILYFS